MNIKVYIDEKIKNKHQLGAIKEFDKRLSRYCKIKLVTIKPSELDSISDKTHKIYVHESGESITSEGLSDKLNHLGVTGKSDVAFILMNTDTYEETMCLSSMTLSTGMTVTVLYEQIYRAYRIMRNEPYHK
jgi:23S rRNA (pseudouridine1915-N3)-methyltransferase